MTRPDPGLARGLWEAPPWAFVALLVGAVIAALAWGIAAWFRRSARRHRGATR